MVIIQVLLLSQDFDNFFPNQVSDNYHISSFFFFIYFFSFHLHSHLVFSATNNLFSAVLKVIFTPSMASKMSASPSIP